MSTKLDDAVKELELLARKLGFSLRVLQTHAPSGTQTLEISVRKGKDAEPPRLTDVARDWKHVG